MYIVRNEHLEKVRKALEKSNKVLNNIPETLKNSADIISAIRENDKAISLINDEYLEIQND